MNVVLWARVSSREQREGYSIDAQLRAMWEKTAKADWRVVRECVVAESAKRGAERTAFNEMLKWVRANARRENIRAILSHKLDRVCRNMRDAVRLQELEDDCGVQLAFVENEFAPGAAGLLSFNVMAAVAQYYSDNLRSEVIKGIDEKVRQGWPTGLAPFGYLNVEDKSEPIQPHPEKAEVVIRIFELYALGNQTFETTSERLAAEGMTYRPSQPSFNRTALSYILNNRFYIGQIRHRGRWFPGKHRPLIDLATFDACQAALSNKNRRNGVPRQCLSGGLFRCVYCGRSLTGEHIRRKLRGGGVREHQYLRCANNSPGADHPRVRWRSEAFEQAVIDDLSKLRIENAEAASWFRSSLIAAFDDISTTEKRQAAVLAKRQAELKSMQDRLLNAFLATSIDQATFDAKSAELRDEIARVRESEAALAKLDPRCAESALAVFDWSQNAAQTWRGSNNAVRREILDAICLNRAVSDVTLVTVKRKPFDILAEGLSLKKSRGDRI